MKVGEDAGQGLVVIKRGRRQRPFFVLVQLQDLSQNSSKKIFHFL